MEEWSQNQPPPACPQLLLWHQGWGGAEASGAEGGPSASPKCAPGFPSPAACTAWGVGCLLSLGHCDGCGDVVGRADAPCAQWLLEQSSSETGSPMAAPGAWERGKVCINLLWSVLPCRADCPRRAQAVGFVWSSVEVCSAGASTEPGHPGDLLSTQWSPALLSLVASALWSEKLLEGTGKLASMQMPTGRCPPLAGQILQTL